MPKSYEQLLKDSPVNVGSTEPFADLFNADLVVTDGVSDELEHDGSDCGASSTSGITEGPEIHDFDSVGSDMTENDKEMQLFQLTMVNA